MQLKEMNIKKIRELKNSPRGLKKDEDILKIQSEVMVFLAGLLDRGVIDFDYEYSLRTPVVYIGHLHLGKFLSLPDSLKRRLHELANKIASVLGEPSFVEDEFDRISHLIHDFRQWFFHQKHREQVEVLKNMSEIMIILKEVWAETWIFGVRRGWGFTDEEGYLSYYLSKTLRGLSDSYEYLNKKVEN